MTEEEKLSMFENRLLKVYKHKIKLARRQHIACYRVYDHDMPEFPFCIELYEDKIYLAEYLRHHGMTDEEHDVWLDACIALIGKLLEVPGESYRLFRHRLVSRSSHYKADGKRASKR